MSHLRVVPGGAPRAAGPKAGSASSVRVEAPGKVNLFLSCGAPGADGYHPLTTVFQAVRLIETVTARRQAADARGAVTLTLAEPDDAVPTDERNLAVRAARLLARETGVEEGVDLLVRKRVPVAGWRVVRPTPRPRFWPATSCGAPASLWVSSWSSPPSSVRTAPSPSSARPPSDTAAGTSSALS